MDRYWFITSTFYGTWLPGDERGFVSRVEDRREGDLLTDSRQIHNVPETQYDRHIPGLVASAYRKLKCDPIFITLDHAEVLLPQFQETATYRRWELRAAAIMANHVHWIVGVLGDPDPEDIMRDLKAYGSRALSKKWGKPASDTWWTENGSTRKLKDEAAVIETTDYVLRRQKAPLLLWGEIEGRLPIPASGAA